MTDKMVDKIVIGIRKGTKMKKRMKAKAKQFRRREQSSVDRPIKFDNTQAYREGWGVFCRGDNGKLALQKLDDPQSIHETFPKNPVFDSDDAAYDFVRHAAENGSAYHKKALDLTKYVRTLTFEDAIQEISDCLAQADGEFIAKIFNQVFPKPVKLVGNNMFEQDDEE